MIVHVTNSRTFVPVDNHKNWKDRKIGLNLSGLYGSEIHNNNKKGTSTGGLGTRIGSYDFRRINFNLLDWIGRLLIMVKQQLKSTEILRKEGTFSGDVGEKDILLVLNLVVTHLTEDTSTLFSIEELVEMARELKNQHGVVMLATVWAYSTTSEGTAEILRSILDTIGFRIVQRHYPADRFFSVPKLTSVQGANNVLQAIDMIPDNFRETFPLGYNQIDYEKLFYDLKLEHVPLPEGHDNPDNLCTPIATPFAPPFPMGWHLKLGKRSDGKGS